MYECFMYLCNEFNNTLVHCGQYSVKWDYKHVRLLAQRNISPNLTYTGCYNKCDFWGCSVFNERRRWAPHIYNMGNLASKIKHCIIQIVLWQKSIPLCCLHLSISHSHTITIPTHLGQGKICNHHSLFTLEGCTM